MSVKWACVKYTQEDVLRRLEQYDGTLPVRIYLGDGHILINNTCTGYTMDDVPEWLQQIIQAWQERVGHDIWEDAL